CEQAGVNAPGTAKRATFLPPKSSSVVMSFGPSGVICLSVADGILSPTWMVIGESLGVVFGRRSDNTGRRAGETIRPITSARLFRCESATRICIGVQLSGGKGHDGHSLASGGTVMSLTGQLLVAMPQMLDQRFARSVVYICAHSGEAGAMGLVINKL